MSEELASERLVSQASETKVQQAVNKIVGDSVLVGLSHFGNKNVVDSLLYILELEHSVNIYNIAFDLSTFRSGVSAMFGSGGYVLEEHIGEEIARRLGIDRSGKKLEALVDLLVQTARENQDRA